MGWSEYRRSSSEGLTCVVVSFQLEEAEWVGLSIEEALQKVKPVLVYHFSWRKLSGLV